MNPWQMAQQIRSELTTVAWPGGAADVVFGARGVKVFAGTPTEEQIPPGFPWALVGVGTATADEDHPELVTQQFDVLVGVEVAGDPMGEFALIGSSIGNVGKSVGRGWLEVVERAQSAVQKLTGADGAKILVSQTDVATPEVLGNGRHLVVGGMTLSCLCTTELHYAAPQEAAETGGTLTWEGAHCSDRFDFKQYRVFEESGTTPSADPVSNGSLHYTGTAATTTGATSGNVYSVFADYNPRDTSGSVIGTSSVEVGCWVAKS